MKIGIAGAGIMGRLLAYAFINQGDDVSLFDYANDLSCSHAAAGMLAPLSELEKCDISIFQLGNDALNQHWPSILKKLDKDIFFQKKGTITLSHPADKSDLIRFVHLINSKLSNPHLIKLNQRELQTYEPELNQFNEGYYLPEEGQLDNLSLLNALKEFLCYQGVRWTKHYVTQMKPGIIKTESESYDFDLVVDCRGMGGQSSFVNLQSIRGELIWLHAPEVNINRPIRLMHPRYHLYIATRPDHIYLIGASEIYAEDYSNISVRTSLELLTAAYSLHSGFAEARIIKTVTQCRPTLPHHLPKIKYTDGYIAINGLYRHGFLIAPSIMMDVLTWVNQGSSFVCYPQLWEKFDDKHLSQCKKNSDRTTSIA